MHPPTNCLATQSTFSSLMTSISSGTNLLLKISKLKNKIEWEILIFWFHIARLRLNISFHYPAVTMLINGVLLESLPAVYPNCYKLFFVWLSKFNNWMECSNIIVDSRYLDICLIEVMVDTWQLRNRRAGLHSSHSPVWALQCASVPVHYGGSIWIMSYTYRVTGLKEATREERKKWTTCEGRWVLLFTWCLSRLHLRISPLLRAGLQECEWRVKPRHRVATVQGALLQPALSVYVHFDPAAPG